jgi:hypothetical protein
MVALSEASANSTPSNSPNAYQKPISLMPRDSAASPAALARSAGLLTSALTASGV